MIYCNYCGRYFCSDRLNCCPYCGCCCHKCIQRIFINGPQGPIGPQGLQGATGPQGIQGVTGPQGIQGETGLQGIQGVTGPQGIQGVTGPQGIQGVTGPQGIQGVTGLQGIQGVTGLQGIQGVTGPQGIQGETGPQGIQGVTGLQGEQGYTPNIGENGNWYINGTDTGKPSRGQQGENGDSAANYTTIHLSAIHTGGISLTVPVDGIAIPMPSTILNGFTANGTFDTFTADYGGVYLLIYNIKTTANTTVKTRLIRNGNLLSGTVRSTSVPSANYSLSLLIRLTAGDQLQLQLYDLNDVIVGLQGGTGASLVLVRLSE